MSSKFKRVYKYSLLLKVKNLLLNERYRVQDDTKDLFSS